MACKVKYSKKRVPRIKTLVLSCALIAFGCVVIIYPERYVAACFEGLCLWAQCVLPSLFPFMVICLLLIRLNTVEYATAPFKKLFKRAGLPAETPALFFMGLCSGYPAGSRILCEYYGCGKLSRADCKKLAPLVSACGPLFAIGNVGFKAFGSREVGAKLFFACLVSVVITSFIYCLLNKNKTEEPHILKVKSQNADLLSDCFTSAVGASLTAGAFICFFYTVARVAADFNLFAPLQLLLSPIVGEESAVALCRGLVEATGGCFYLARCGDKFCLPLAGFLLTFGGASILLQQQSYLSRCGVSAKFFILFKFIQSLLSFALLCIF